MYIVKFVCDDRAEILINGKYSAKNKGPRVSTVSISEKPHSIVAKCTDIGGRCGFRLVCIDATTGEVICKTGLNDGWTSDTGKIVKGTQQDWGSEIGAIAIWSYPVPNIHHRDTKTCTLYWEREPQNVYESISKPFTVNTNGQSINLLPLLITGAIAFIALLAIMMKKKKSK